jgi:hypothetical protein
MKSNQTIAVALLLEISFLAGVASAQQISGSITGVVQDPQAQVVPNARVTLINQSQGVTAMQMSPALREPSFSHRCFPPPIQ